MTDDVPWSMFVAYPDGHAKFSDDWLLTASNVTSTYRDGARYCRLCDRYFKGLPEEHVAAHAPSLRAWREEQRTKKADPETEEKLVAALDLVEQGMSQRGAAERAGIPRSTLRDAVLRRAAKRTGVDGDLGRVSTHVEARPPVDAVTSGAGVRETDAPEDARPRRVAEPVGARR